MATIVTRESKGAALSWSEADANITNLNTAKLEALSGDLAPQLSGNLDTNDKTITTSVTNGNLTLSPNGTGWVIIDNAIVGQGRGTGANNTVLGRQALTSATTGPRNTAIGDRSLFGVTNGTDNIGIGVDALWRNANNSGNVAIGNYALDFAVSGSNTAVGHNAGTALDTGSTNTFIGHGAGSAITSGSNNVILGSNTGSTISGTSNNIIISDGSGNIRLQIDNTGKITFGTLSLPTSDGTNGQVLTTNGAGTLSFSTMSYTETDPVFVASPSYGITSTDITEWDTAYGWGNHSTAGYLTSSAIGTTIQAYDADLTSWAGLAPTSKQDTLVSGTSIKTINNQSILGSGNITIEGGSGGAGETFNPFLLMGC